MLNVCYVTDIDTHEETIGSVFDAKYKILDRMRLACEIFGEDDRPVKRCPMTGKSRLPITCRSLVWAKS